MALEIELQVEGFALDGAEERRIRRQLAGLEKRLAHRPEPRAALVLEHHAGRREVEADLRVKLGPLGSHLISRRAAGTADQAARLAVEDVERQLERQDAAQRGEHTYGVPSRRLPKQLRPNPPTAGEGGTAGRQEGETEDEETE